MLNAISTYGSLSILNLKQCSLTNKKSIKKSLGLAKYPQVLLVSPHSARGISHYQGLRIPKGARRFPISGRSQLLPALTGCWKLLPLLLCNPSIPLDPQFVVKRGWRNSRFVDSSTSGIWRSEFCASKYFPSRQFPQNHWLRFQYIIDTMSLIKSRYCGDIWLIRGYGNHMKSWHLGFSHILTWSHILWHVAVRLCLLSSD